MNQAQKFVAFVKDQPKGSTEWVNLIGHHAQPLIKFNSPSEVYDGDRDLDHEIDLPEDTKTTVMTDYVIYQFADMSMVVKIQTKHETYITLFGLIGGVKAKIDYIKPNKE